MKISIAIGITEGFVSTIGIFTADGLLLGHSALHWDGKKKRLEKGRQLKAFVDGLAAIGVEVDGKEKLNTLVAEWEGKQ
ncbi:MAG: hypothetical protein IT435_02620 [Phycisphaerales bacterium]|nr:hypothetical protein [Phycisphaerales bacterium]